MTTQTPNDALADKIVSSLIEKGLLKKNREAEVRKSIITGKAKAEDWRVWAEDFMREEAGNGEQETPETTDN